MILSRNTIIRLIYPEQYKQMASYFNGYNDLEFMDFARSCFENIELLTRGTFAV